MVRERKLPLIARGEFGLTSEDVYLTSAQLAADLGLFETMQEDPDYNRPNGKVLQIEGWRDRLTVLTAAPADETVSKLKDIYLRTIQLTRMGYSPSRVVPRLLGEFPDIDLYYPVLRRRSWGYHLGSRIMHLQDRRRDQVES